MSIPSIRARRAPGARAAESARRASDRSKLFAAAASGVVVALLVWGGVTAAQPGGAPDGATAVSTGRAVAGSDVSVAKSGPAVHRVEMRGFAFVLAELTVAIGDTIVWTNADLVPHTATSVDGSWDTGTVAAGDSARAVVEGPGSYVCTFHPSMTGVLVAPPS